MDSLIYNGDFTPSGGGFKTVSGNDELLQRALICLAVKKGSFALYPTLGSTLYKLHAGDGNLYSGALAAANEALLSVGLRATSVNISAQDDSVTFDFVIGAAGGNVSVTV